MSTITLRFQRGKHRWRNRSHLTFHLEDWDFNYTDNGIETHPRPVSLLWRIATAVLFLGISVYLAFSFVPALWRGEIVHRGSPSRQSVAVVAPSLRAPIASHVSYQSNILPPGRQPQATQDTMPPIIEELEQRLSPESRAKVQQQERERAEQQRQQAVRQKRADHVSRFLTMVGLPVTFLLISLFTWIGVQYGLLEIIRFPIDRVSMHVDHHHGLTIRRAGLLRDLVVTRPLSQLAGITCRVRQIGGGGDWRHGISTYHWLAILHSRCEREWPQIELFIEFQWSPATADQPLPARFKEFLHHMQRLTGCPSRRIH